MGNNKKQVLYIGGFEFPNKNAAAQRVLANGKIFREMGYDVIFIGVDKSGARYESINKSLKVVDGFKTYSTKYPTTNLEWFKNTIDLGEVEEFIYENKLNLEMIISYNYSGFLMNKIKKICRKNHIKYISDCTEWYDCKNKNVIKYLVKYLESTFRMRYIQKYIDGVICISPFLFDYYKDYTNVILVPPLVDLSDEKFNVASNGDDKEHESIVKLVYAGSPEIYKKNDSKDRLDLVIEALSVLKSNNIYLRFDVVGIEQKDYLNCYNEQRELLEDLKNIVSFHGRMPHLEALHVIKESDFSIFLKNLNRVNMAGFPTKFVESISCGTPVITNDNRNLNLYLKSGLGFVVKDLNKDEIVRTLQDVSKMDKSQIKSMKATCLEYKNFNYKYYISEFRNFVEKILK